MKRFFIILSMYILFLSIPVQGESLALNYKIQTSSKEESLRDIKEKVLIILDDLCTGVEKESYKTIVKENLDLFVFDYNTEVKFKRNTLYIVVGEGKGKILHGIYEKNMCFEKVKTKSIIKEWMENRE